jgi:23S rRNA (guanine745-N1)-methyltransferase
MKNNEVSKIFIDNIIHLMCPLCGASFRVIENMSLICIENNHCFDIASKGYVNFIPNKRQESEQYSKKLFESRTSVFKAGVYDKLLNEIYNTISSKFAQVTEDDRYNLLDVGCGEGYYAAKLSEKPKLNIFAIDIVKDAILAACKKKVPVTWMVADLTKIPMQNSSVDILLNVLTTANYEEFKRVLKKDGIIIKVIPGSDYLKEIRDIVKSKLRNKEYSNDSVVAHFKKQVTEVEMKTLNYKFPVDENLLKQFMLMTPMTAGIDIEGLELGGISHITIDLKVLIGSDNGVQVTT